MSSCSSIEERFSEASQTDLGGIMPALSRRDLLWRLGGGLGGVALAQLLSRDGLLAAGTNHAPKARRVIQLFMNGGASQMDTFDHKPELEKQHGKKVDLGITAAATSVPGAVM